jgi:predicted alpha/beta hydrolase
MTNDGVQLTATLHEPPGSSLGVVIVLPATGASRDRYDEFAAYLARRNWNGVTFDYRGIGESKLETHMAHTASMLAWGERDLSATIEWARSRLLPKRVVLVGHSIGGQIIPLATNHHQVNAILLIAAQKGYWRLWHAPEKYIVWSFFRLYIPLCLRLFGRVPLKFAGLDDLPANVARDYARWTLQLPYLDEANHDLTPRFAALRAPILALSFEDDTQYAPRATVDFLLRSYYLNAPTWHSHIIPRELGLAGLGHAGFFDPLRCPRSYWDETVNWLKAAADGLSDDYSFAVLPGVEHMTDKYSMV